MHDKYEEYDMWKVSKARACHYSKNGASSELLQVRVSKVFHENNISRFLLFSSSLILDLETEKIQKNFNPCLQEN